MRKSWAQLELDLQKPTDGNLQSLVDETLDWWKNSLNDPNQSSSFVHQEVAERLISIAKEVERLNGKFSQKTLRKVGEYILTLGEVKD